jgi:tetratricopeptide (TPR) repeat protein
VIDYAIRGLNAQQEDEALPAVRAALLRHPANAQLWQMLGLLHRALDRLDEAIPALDKAALLAPRDARIAHARARAHLEAGQPSVALFDQALKLAPKDEGVRLGRIESASAEAGIDAAIAAGEEELRRTPAWAAGQAEVARLRWMAGDRSDYARDLRDALRSHPRDLGLWAALLNALSHAGAHEALIAAADEGRRAAGPHPLFDVNEAVAQDALGRPELAAPLFTRARAENDPHMALHLVRHHLRTGKLDPARELAERWAASAYQVLYWPYLSIICRLQGNVRAWEWLEGDERLIGVYDLAEPGDWLESLREELVAIHSASNQPLDQSLRGGTQTSGGLFPRLEPAIRKLRTLIAGAVQRHLAQLPPQAPRHPTLYPERNRPVRFAGSWSVRLGAQGFHVSHTHPSGWYSSAFYVALPEAPGPAPGGWLALGEPPSELGIDLPPIRLIEPRPGRLVLFPSTMWHGTRPFNDGERLTVAFDVAYPPLPSAAQSS